MTSIASICAYLSSTYGQVWYHNREFRTAVLLWEDPDADAADENVDQGNVIVYLILQLTAVIYNAILLAQLGIT